VTPTEVRLDELEHRTSRTEAAIAELGVGMNASVAWRPAQNGAHATAEIMAAVARVREAQSERPA
jgi:hypothetical protein